MQKWEYVTIYVSAKSIPEIIKINDEEIAIMDNLGEYQDGYPLWKYLNQMGTEGWEAVTSNVLTTSTAGLK